MYKFNLAESYVPSQLDAEVLETTVGGCLREAASRWPDSEALIEVLMDGSSGRRWTFTTLLEESLKLAGALSTRFQPGEKICIWAPNIPEWVLVEYACGLAGLVLVTANPAYQASELRYVLEQSDSCALFLVPEYRGNPMGAIAQEAVSGNPKLREILDLSDHNALFATVGNVGKLPQVYAGDAVQIQYTSGTTGFPKGAVLHHRGLTNNARYYATRMNGTDQDVWVAMMPLFHTAGCAMIMLGAVQLGIKVVLVPVFEPATILELVAHEGLTALLGVPTMFVALVQAQKQIQVDVSGVKIAGCGGAMVAPDLVRSMKDAFECDFITVYGQTEASPLITMHYSNDTIEDLCATVGQPLPQTEVSIRSTNDNTVVAIGQIGEICTRGVSVMLGYNKNPDATRKAIDLDGWLHTGDLGTMDARGYMAVTGRLKEMIIRGGENLFPAEIENVLLDHDNVAETAVVGLPDEKWGEIVACFVRTQGALDIAALRRHCRAHLAPQKTPSIWVEVENFPLTGSGKIRKFKLAEDFAAGVYQALDS